VRRALVHRAGLRAEIVEGGTISVGDPVEAVEAVEAVEPNGEAGS
jgi:MOSC domain-containing protein YiiM